MTTAIRNGQVTDNSAAAIPVPGASIYVYNLDGTAASLTSDGVTPITQPLTTDQFGNYTYQALVGYYREDTWFEGKLRFRENNIALGSPGADLALRTDLAATGGAGLVAFSAGGSYSAGTIGDWLQNYANKSTSTHSFLWGATGGAPVWDTVSDYQAFFAQTQPTFLLNGSLGALYGQRIASYTGGAVSDSASPVIGAVRGYNQVQATVTYSVEAAGLFTTDNYSYLSQGVGVSGQGNSYHGGRVWGLIGEAKEFPETFTATVGQTVFAVPNGFNAVGAVTKNGTLLTVTTDYTAATPNVTLTAGAASGDIIKVYRANPQNSPMGAEIDVFAAAGADTANPISGNRVGVSIFGYRIDKTFAASTHIGTLLNLVSDPTDASLTVDRGILFQGKFATGIDFTASNFTASNWLIKLGSASGVDASGNILGAGRITSTGGGVGYATGAGGTVTQATSKATAVTLNKVCGQITLNNASLAANTVVSFVLTNSNIAATDIVRINTSGAAAAGSYLVQAEALAAGSCTISVRNLTAGALAEALVLNFALIKAVAA